MPSTGEDVFTKLQALSCTEYSKVISRLGWFGEWPHRRKASVAWADFHLGSRALEMQTS